MPTSGTKSGKKKSPQSPHAARCKTPPSSDAEVVIEVGKACQPILKQLGFRISDCIACGYEGCVFKLSKGRIAKITPRISEPQFSALIAEMDDPHPSLPRVDGVYALPAACTEDIDPSLIDELGYAFRKVDTESQYRYGKEDPEYPEVYMIVREDLSDLELEHPSVFGYALDAIHPPLKRVYEQNESPGFLREMGEVIAQRKGLSGYDLKAFLELVDLFAWGAERGIHFADIFTDNLGMRKNGTLVVRDLGFSKSKSKGKPGVIAPLVE